MRANLAALAGLGFLGALACGDDGEGLGPVDAGRPDAALVDGAADAGVADGGSGFDAGSSGRPDAGFSDPSVIAQGKTTLGRVRLFTTVRGTLTSTMPPVVILPTGPMHGQEYLYEPTAFLLGPGGPEAPDRLLVYLDPRATGRSDTAGIGDTEVTVERHVADVENLVAYLDELLDASPRLDFLGHGWGAGLAALYAARHPERVSRLVLANPFPVDVQDYALWKQSVEERLTSSELETINQIKNDNWFTCRRDFSQCARDLWRIWGPAWACPENRAIVQSMRFEHLDLEPFEFFIDRDLRELEYDWRSALARISDVPTTVISGPCDPIPARTPLTYTASIAGAAHHVVEGTGHFTLTEAPEAFARIVRHALAR